MVEERRTDLPSCHIEFEHHLLLSKSLPIVFVGWRFAYVCDKVNQ